MRIFDTHQMAEDFTIVKQFTQQKKHPTRHQAFQNSQLC